MNDEKRVDGELEFTHKYDLAHAQRYEAKHRASLSRRFSDWREQNMARKALSLAGNPGSVLDLPCGAGRFLPLLGERADRELLAADYSEGMLEVTRRILEPKLLQRVKLFQTSAFDIDLADGSVDCVFSMRLLHHIGAAEDRLKIFREFHRVTRDTAVLSLWVDGNYKAWRRKRLEARRPSGKYQNRFVIPAEQVESEFQQVGFDLVGKVDFLPRYALWRCYVLQKK